MIFLTIIMTIMASFVIEAYKIPVDRAITTVTVVMTSFVVEGK